MSEKHRRGKWGERLAEAYLRSLGFIVIRSNCRVGKAEIDLLCKDQQCLVLVEVKTRYDLSFGPASESITDKKIALYYQAGEELIHQYPSCEELRCDLILIVGSYNEFEIKHIKSAF